MPSSAQLKLATNLLGVLSQPAVAGAGSLGELQLNWHGGTNKLKLPLVVS